MPITAITADTTVEKLVTRVHGKLPDAQLRAATEATLAANPHLAGLSRLPAGAVVVVPPLDQPPGAPPARGGGGRAGARASEDAVRAIADALAEYRDQLAARGGEREEALAETQRVLDSNEFRRAIHGVEEAAPLVERLGAAVEAEREELAAMRKMLGKEARSLRDALQALGERTG